MNELIVPQVGYVLLDNNNQRKSCLQKYRFSLLILLLISSLFLLIVIYIVTVGIRFKVLYPSKLLAEDVPYPWIRRAEIYNDLDKAVFKDDPSPNLRPDLNFVDKYKLVCYYYFPNDSFIQDNRSGILEPEHVDPFLCTHINVCFARVVNNTVYFSDVQLNYSRRFIALKEINKDLKVLFSIGGATDDDGFPGMVKNHENRKRFIQSVDKLIRDYKFDGVDLDWEFPNENQNGDKRQKIHFMQLLQEIRRNIDRQHKHKYLLSVAVAAPVFIVDVSYNVAYMNEYVDYINLMSYDYHFYTKTTPYTGINAPLYSPPDQIGYFATLNINYSAYYWHFNGMEKNKINIGLPTYGHSYTLLNVRNGGIGAPAKGFGRLGSAGFVDYNQACWFLTENQITSHFDMDTKSPYATKYTEWISYEDTTSLTFKAEFIKNNDFGGAMVYSLNMDDHKGACKRGVTGNKPQTFPLTNTVKAILTNEQL